jgi:hypothetical protein
MNGFIEFKPPHIFMDTAIRSSSIYKVVKRGRDELIKDKKISYGCCYIEYSFRSWGADVYGYDFREEFSTLEERDARYREVMLELTSDSNGCTLRANLIKEHQMK